MDNRNRCSRMCKTNLASQNEIAVLIDRLEHSSRYLGEKLLQKFRYEFSLAAEAG